MMAFFMFWVAVAATFLSPVPALAGVFLGTIGGFGKIKIAFALAGPAIVLLTVAAYLSDRYAPFSDHVYDVAVEFFAMLAWSMFTGGVTMSVRELLPVKVRIRL